MIRQVERWLKPHVGLRLINRHDGPCHPEASQLVALGWRLQYLKDGRRFPLNPEQQLHHFVSNSVAKNGAWCFIEIKEYVQSFNMSR
jgi:hypothetical protein